MKALLIVIDSFGIGHLPDADQYGDVGANTALHVCEFVKKVELPNLQGMGLGNCSMLLGNPLPGLPASENPSAAFGVMRQRSPGKDTTTGHWELAGIVLPRPFRTFPGEAPSFPSAIIESFCREAGVEVLGNEAASGIEIIHRLGEEHVKSGDPIVYTSADSVFQIAAHEAVIPVDRLYEMCAVARRICDPFMVGRVIARPFTGGPGNYQRTDGRRDFSIALPEPSVLDALHGSGIRTIAVGKIGDIFNQQGIAETHHDRGNQRCLARIQEILSTRDRETFFMFVNLVDTDMIFGHRRDPAGYYNALTEIDHTLGWIAEELDDGDLLLVAADHGCDPTWRGSDHTREHVPILALRKSFKGGSVGIRDTFADTAQTIATFFGIAPLKNGCSLW